MWSWYKQNNCVSDDWTVLEHPAIRFLSSLLTSPDGNPHLVPPAPLLLEDAQVFPDHRRCTQWVQSVPCCFFPVGHTWKTFRRLHPGDIQSRSGAPSAYFHNNLNQNTLMIPGGKSVRLWRGVKSLTRLWQERVKMTTMWTWTPPLRQTLSYNPEESLLIVWFRTIFNDVEEKTWPLEPGALLTDCKIWDEYEYMNLEGDVKSAGSMYRFRWMVKFGLLRKY